MTSYTAYLVLRDTDWSVKKKRKKKETNYVIDDLIFLFAIKAELREQFRSVFLTKSNLNTNGNGRQRPFCTSLFRFKINWRHSLSIKCHVMT